MREIIFRGKSVNDGRWVFGNLSDYGDCKTITTVKDCSIIDSCEVIPETVGQYTGLRDKNSTRVFEGNIVKYTEIDIDGSDDKYIGVIYYNQSKANYVIQKRKYMVNFVTSWIGDVEVIGNIWDNPELLKGGQENGRS